VANSLVVTLGRNQYSVQRSTLRQWLELEEIVNKIKEGTGKAQNIYLYLSIVIGEDIDLSEVPWYETAEAFSRVLILNSTKHEFPILKTKMKDSKVSWDYEGRTFYIWANIFASKYGWHINYISKLDIDDAIALAQEITVDEQLQREWEWSLSEKSIKWSRKGKGTFQPLERPDWMNLPVDDKELEKTKLPIGMIPVGVVVKFGDLGDETLKS